MITLEKERIGIDRIEDMILLGDDVLRTLHMNYSSYTDSGDDIFDLYYEDYKNHDREALHEVISAERQKNTEHEHLLSELFRNIDYELTDILNLSSDEIIERYIYPIIDKAVSIFRKGTSFGDTKFIADDSVSDEYLKELFAMRVRDRMIVSACQRFEKTYYFLTWSTPCCHDMDEWIGIYDNINKLHVAYDKEMAKEDSEYRPEYLMIFEFKEGEPYYKPVKPEELWGVIE